MSARNLATRNYSKNISLCWSFLPISWLLMSEINITLQKFSFWTGYQKLKFNLQISFLENSVFLSVSNVNFVKGDNDTLAKFWYVKSSSEIVNCFKKQLVFFPLKMSQFFSKAKFQEFFEIFFLYTAIIQNKPFISGRNRIKIFLQRFNNQ